MTLATFLQSVCELLQRGSNVPVALGLPAEGASGLFVWPWSIAENQASKNRPLPFRQELSVAHPRGYPFDVHFLIFACPATTPEGLSLLESARQSILDTPVIGTDEDKTALMIEELPILQQTGLFAAAGLPFCVCLCVMGTLVGGPQLGAGGVPPSSDVAGESRPSAGPRRHRKMPK